MRRCLLLGLPKFDIFAVVMRISPHLLYSPLKVVVDRYCIRLIVVAVGANEKNQFSDVK